MPLTHNTEDAVSACPAHLKFSRPLSKSSHCRHLGTLHSDLSIRAFGVGAAAAAVVVAAVLVSDFAETHRYCNLDRDIEHTFSAAMYAQLASGAGVRRAVSHLSLCCFVNRHRPKRVAR